MSRSRGNEPIPPEAEKNELWFNTAYALKYFQIAIDGGVLPTTALTYMLDDDIPAWKRNENFEQWKPRVEMYLKNLEHTEETDRLREEIQKRDDAIAQQGIEIEMPIPDGTPESWDRLFEWYYNQSEIKSLRDLTALLPYGYSQVSKRHAEYKSGK